jgi:methylmalonyl-CoA mutase N-terminal domain/subunit
LRVRKVILPKYKDWGDILTWQLQENIPGEFPYTAGVFPLKREGEDPTRMFAGEGGPERTNKRFIMFLKGSLQSACPQRLTVLRCMEKILQIVRIFTAKLVTVE